MYDFRTVLNRYNTGSSKWEEMKKYGITDDTIVPLSNAEMEFANAPEIKQGLKDYIETAVLSYFDPMPEYFEAVRTWFSKRYSWDFPVEAILPNPNLHTAVCAAVMAYSSEGDDVVVMQPTWPGFFGAVRNNGRNLVANQLHEEDDIYSIDFSLLEEQLSKPQCSMMLLCSPHNPVGRVWTRDELSRIGALCIKHHITIVSDEIHADLTMPGYKHYPLASLSPELAEITVSFTGASKAFNLAGLDTANVIITNEAHREKFCAARRREGISTPNMLGLKACELAYTVGEPWLDACVKQLADNAAFVRNYLREHIPALRCTTLEGTYLMWLDLRSLKMECKALEEALMREARLFMDDGYYFGVGGEGFVRMNIACPQSVLRDALSRLEAWVNSL